MGEKMTALPEGWTIEEEDSEMQPQEESDLPKGWTIEEEKPEIDPETERIIRKFSETPAATFPTGRAREAFTKSAISEITFGHSEKLPGLEKIEEEPGANIMGQLVGSLPLFELLTKVFAGPALKLAAKSPVFQKQLASLATMFGVGFTEAGIHKVAKGQMPTLDDMLEHGTDWATLDALLQAGGATGKFALQLGKSALGKILGKKEAVNRVYEKLLESGVDMTNAEKVSEKALEILKEPITDADLLAAEKLKLPEKQIAEETQVAKDVLGKEEITPKDLKTRKIKEDSVNKLNSESISLSEPYQPKGNYTQEADKLAQDSIALKLETVSPRAASEEELGNAIRENVETQLETLKKEYRPLYDYVEEKAPDLYHYPNETANVAKGKLKKLSNLTTKPEGYPKVIQKLENVLKDLGYHIQRDEAGKISEIVRASNVRLSDSIELARRLNEMIDFEAIEPQVKDALKGVVKQLKEDIRTALKQNPEALAAFEMAEAEHARVARLYGKDSILNIRGQEAGDKIARMMESSSVLGDLRKTLSPEQYAQVEREVLEKLNTLNFEKGKKKLREIEQHLSEKNKKLAREIVESKNPHNTEALKRLEKEGILEDMSRSFTTGERPNKTLKLWKTRKGQKLVKEAFHNSPNWPQVKGYLEKQSFNDMVSSVLKDGKLDLKKFKEFMDDPAVMFNIREQGGEEALTFFRDLNGNVKQLEKNVKLLEKLPNEFEIKKGRELVAKKKKEISDEERGKELLRRTKEQNLSKNKPIVEIGKTKLGTKKELGEAARIKKESSLEKGNALLERMSRKDYPIQNKINDWKEWFKDTMGLNSQAAMTIFGMAKLATPVLGSFTVGIPTTVASLIGYKMMSKMLTSPKVRKAFMKAAQSHTNSFKFTLALHEFNEAMEEEEE